MFETRNIILNEGHIMNYKKALNLCMKRYKRNTRKRDEVYFKILKRIDKINVKNQEKIK